LMLRPTLFIYIGMYWERSHKLLNILSIFLGFWWICLLFRSTSFPSERDTWVGSITQQKQHI
jgi:hypothetical protein